MKKGERDYDFLERILKDDNVVMAINNNMEKIEFYIPEIKHMKNFNQKDPEQHLDLWNHTLLSLYNSENDIDVRLALLLHDIGKPFSYQEGKTRKYHEHEKISSLLAKKILERLGYSEQKIKTITFLIKNHDKRIDEKLILENTPLAIKLYQVQSSNISAHNPKKIEDQEKYLVRIKQRIKIEETRLYYF